MEWGGNMSPRVVPKNRVADIVRAAIQVFGNKGFRLARMEDIAEEAGVSAGTLYNHFKNKVHLFSYVLQNGIPEEDAPSPLAEKAIIENEKEMLKMMRRRLRVESRFRSIDRLLRKRKKDIDLERELTEILEEWWGLYESNRVQIIIAERSLSEFPEMERIYVKYGPRQQLDQIEEYLTVRIRQGMIRPLNSISGMARTLMESVSWFGWRQFDEKFGQTHPKSQILPDLVVMLADGLKVRKLSKVTKPGGDTT
jgi:AcrR family transcriptional regulator